MHRTSTFRLDFSPGIFPVSIAIGGLLLMAGCMQTSMLPARQLGAGETALSASVHVPPRIPSSTEVNGQVTFGWGEGDLSLNLSVNQEFFSPGIAPRIYLSDRLNLQGQLRLGTPGLLAVVGLQSVPSGTRPLYVGGYGGVLAGPLWNTGLLGGRVGATFDLGGGAVLQVEVEGSYPLNEEVDVEEEPPVPGRLSLGIFGLFE